MILQMFELLPSGLRGRGGVSTTRLCYRGSGFKKICHFGALLGPTSKRPKAGSDLRNQSHSSKKSQY
jgi:hypothetical protein